MSLFLLQFEGDLETVLLWLVFIAIPIVGRIIGWIVSKTSSKTPSTPADPPQRKPPDTRRETMRRRARELEEQGEDLWRRLLQGDSAGPDEAGTAAPPEPGRSTTEEPAPSLAPPPRPRPAQMRTFESRPQPVPERTTPPVGELPGARVLVSGAEGQFPHDELPSTTAVPTAARRLAGARPSQSMPRIRPLSSPFKEAPEGSRPRALGALQRRRRAQVGGRDLALELRLADHDELRRAIVWSEILRKPVAMRRQR